MTPLSDDAVPAIDRLSALFERFRMRAHLFHEGPLCGVTHFDAQPGRAFLHVLRRGDMEVVHRPRSGVPRRRKISEPTLLFYPRPLDHAVHCNLQDGSDFVCATLDFDGGTDHPLVRALPSMLALRIADVEGIDQTLALLFAEAERVRCGHRLLADRLFEVLVLLMLRWLLDHPAQAGIQAGLLPGLAHPKLSRALTRIHERPGDAWPLEAMASEAGMSRSAFAAEFRACVGTTPADYLLRWRMSIARSLLRDGMPVKQASELLGYASAAAFTRAFAHVVGQPPRDWVKAASG